MKGMSGKDVVTQPQPAKLSKDGEHPEVELALYASNISSTIAELEGDTLGQEHCGE